MSTANLEPADPGTAHLSGCGLAGRISIVPKPFPKEFRRDVIAVARQAEQLIAQVARSFGSLAVVASG
jgi:hypothetical protein